MSRSKWKFPFIDKSLLKLFGKKKKQTWSRRSSIYPILVGSSLKIHNGQMMIQRKITEEMIGHKLGEFVRTRKPYNPPKKKKIK